MQAGPPPSSRGHMVPRTRAYGNNRAGPARPTAGRMRRWPPPTPPSSPRSSTWRRARPRGTSSPSPTGTCVTLAPRRWPRRSAATFPRRASAPNGRSRSSSPASTARCIRRGRGSSTSWTGGPPRQRWAPTGWRARSIRTRARGSRPRWAASLSGSPSGGSGSSSGCRPSGAACSRPARPWRTSSRSRAHAGGAVRGRVSTWTTWGSPRYRWPSPSPSSDSWSRPRPGSSVSMPRASRP